MFSVLSFGFINAFNSLNIFEQLLRKGNMKNFKMSTCYPNSVIVAHPEVEIWVFVKSHVTKWQLCHQHFWRSVPRTHLTRH